MPDSKGIYVAQGATAITRIARTDDGDAVLTTIVLTTVEAWHVMDRIREELEKQ
jgi:hypothetical protein